MAWAADFMPVITREEDRSRAEPVHERHARLHWPGPRVAFEPESDAGPVLITIEYRVDPAHEQEFLTLMQEMERVRRRDGAVDGGLYRDMTDAGLFVGTCYTGSWPGHLRQHRRIMVADPGLVGTVHKLRTGGSPGGVRHFIPAYAEGAKPETGEKA